MDNAQKHLTWKFSGLGLLPSTNSFFLMPGLDRGITYHSNLLLDYCLSILLVQTMVIHLLGKPAGDEINNETS